MLHRESLCWHQVISFFDTLILRILVFVISVNACGWLRNVTLCHWITSHTAGLASTSPGDFIIYYRTVFLWILQFQREKLVFAESKHMKNRSITSWRFVYKDTLSSLRFGTMVMIIASFSKLNTILWGFFDLEKIFWDNGSIFFGGELTNVSALKEPMVMICSCWVKLTCKNTHENMFYYL